jgi:chromosome segregation ATPase
MEYSKSEKHHQIKMNPGSPNSNLREEQEDRQRLEKSNFDLKMRNYYLEENLKRIQDGEHTSSNQNESSRSEITSLKLQLEEKNIELDQRNMILMKAKSAIEQLKAELERLRQENEKQHDLENRMRTLKQLNDDIESDYRGKVSQLEIQLAAARQLSNNKEQEKASVEHKLVFFRRKVN